MNIHVNTILSVSADDPCLCGFVVELALCFLVSPAMTELPREVEFYTLDFPKGGGIFSCVEKDPSLRSERSFSIRLQH